MASELGQWPSKAWDTARSAWNVIRSVGPYLISQSETASEAFIRHKESLASLELGKELIRREIETYSEFKKKLLDQYHSASSSSKRVRIRRDIDDAEKTLRQLAISAKAMTYLPPPTEDHQSGQPEPQPDISDHWMDRFNELARGQNEEWRAELLARALAKESVAPGTVTPRALWLLGTLEESSFHAFSAILDLCSLIAEVIMIPNHEQYHSHSVPSSVLGDGVQIGNLQYILDELGILSNAPGITVTVTKGKMFQASYGPWRYLVGCPEHNFEVRGLGLTRLGASIASFYDAKFNPLGKEIFDSWVGGLDKTQFPVQSIGQE